jgi:hypothetical protein
MRMMEQTCPPFQWVTVFDLLVKRPFTTPIRIELMAQTVDDLSLSQLLQI